MCRTQKDPLRELRQAERKTLEQFSRCLLRVLHWRFPPLRVLKTPLSWGGIGYGDCVIESPFHVLALV
jgi:hypothetical protein